MRRLINLRVKRTFAIVLLAAFRQGLVSKRADVSSELEALDLETTRDSDWLIRVFYKLSADDILVTKVFDPT